MEQENYKWKVCVRCFTYDHAPYITDAMNGFTMQQTDFPFVCCIVDDASTDSEQEVIKKYIADNFEISEETGTYEKGMDYGTLIFASHKTNHNCYFAVLLLKSNHYSSQELKDKKRSYISEWENSCEYEALCEGDDYWIDAMKLQKQVNFLDNNPEYGMCYTNFNILNQKTGKLTKDVFNNLSKNYKSTFATIGDYIISASYVCPPSWLYRIEFMPKPTIKSMDGSFVNFCYFMANTKTKYLNYITSVYRVLPESASHSKNLNFMYKRIRNLLQTQFRLIDHYYLDVSLKSKCLESYYNDNLVILVANSNKNEVEEARKIIKHSTLKQQVLFFCDLLSLNSIVKYLKLKRL